MSRHKVEISGVNTANIKVLTSEETLELFKKMQEGDSLAREELINGNLKLVLSILKKFSGKTDNLDDLFQIGCLGLVKAIDNFDTKYEVKLSTNIAVALGEAIHLSIPIPACVVSKNCSYAQFLGIV